MNEVQQTEITCVKIMVKIEIHKIIIIIIIIIERVLLKCR